MSAFTCGNFVYFKDNDDLPKNHHNFFILNQEPEFTITSPITSPVRLSGKIENVGKMFV